jgi:hypothetical protein
VIDVDEIIRDCPSPKCDGEVLDALIIGPSANREVLLDPVPVGWADGGRYRTRQHQPDPPRNQPPRLHVDELRSAGQSFGSSLLYRKHLWVCGGGSGGRSKSREADG